MDTFQERNEYREEPTSQPAAGGKHLSRKSPVLACFLSLFPGLGQVYVGYYQRGFVFIIVVAVCITILAGGPSSVSPMIGLFMAFFWLFNIIDAGRRASLYNQALNGIGQIEMPKDMQLPYGGSLAGGLLLMVIGIILVLNTRFGVSLDWLEQWWPLALVGLGLYLIVKWWQNR